MVYYFTEETNEGPSLIWKFPNLFIITYEIILKDYRVSKVALKWNMFCLTSVLFAEIYKLYGFKVDTYPLLVGEMVVLVIFDPQSIYDSRVNHNHHQKGEDCHDIPVHLKSGVHPLLRPIKRAWVTFLVKFQYQKRWNID